MPKSYKKDHSIGNREVQEQMENHNDIAILYEHRNERANIDAVENTSSNDKIQIEGRTSYNVEGTIISK